MHSGQKVVPLPNPRGSEEGEGMSALPSLPLSFLAPRKERGRDGSELFPFQEIARKERGRDGSELFSSPSWLSLGFQD